MLLRHVLAAVTAAASGTESTGLTAVCLALFHIAISFEGAPADRTFFLAHYVRTPFLVIFRIIEITFIPVCDFCLMRDGAQ